MDFHIADTSVGEEPARFHLSLHRIDGRTRIRILVGLLHRTITFVFRGLQEGVFGLLHGFGFALHNWNRGGRGPFWSRSQFLASGILFPNISVSCFHKAGIRIECLNLRDSTLGAVVRSGCCARP